MAPQFLDLHASRRIRRVHHRSGVITDVQPPALRPYSRPAISRRGNLPSRSVADERSLLPPLRHQTVMRTLHKMIAAEIGATR